MHHINIGIGKEQLYAIDPTKLDVEVAMSLNHEFGFTTNVHTAQEVSNRFYDLIHVLSRHTRSTEFVQLNDIIRLLVADQVPYTPKKFDQLLTELKECNKVLKERFIHCSQIFIGKPLYQLSSQVTEGYRTYDLSKVSLETLKDNRPLQLAGVDTNIHYSLCYHYDIIHNDIMIAALDDKTSITYNEIVWAELDSILKGKGLHSLGKALSWYDLG